MANERDKQNKYKQRSMSIESMLATAFIFCLLMVALYVVQSSVPYTMRDESVQLIDEKEILEMKTKAEKTVSVNAKYLVLHEKDNEVSKKAMKVIEPVLGQMKIPYDVYDASDFSENVLSKYDYLVLAVDDYSHIADNLGDIKDWVKEGGSLMVLFPPAYNGCFVAMFDIFGVVDCGYTSLVSGVHFMNNLLIGGETQDYEIFDAFESSYAVNVRDDCTVYMQSTDEYPIPLIWSRDCGKGRVVFDNFGIMEKAYRGIHGAAVSLMEDVFIYPVINGATFYIDDFPAPVPEGNGEYISRDYGLSISDFYSQVWWNDVYDLADRHDIRYTGLVVETYSNQISGKFERNEDTERYLYFGNTLLSTGGEIGIHGYNHMPLVLDNYDYEDQYDSYVQWSSKNDIKNSVTELIDFTKTLFPDEDIQVYVPPSNILSEDGREVLAEQGIRTIAAVYREDKFAYVQEFDISTEDGVINTPRVISGYLMDDYDKITALSELNFHLVSTHFQHPDDVLDEDRGADIGWRELKLRFENYLTWLYDAYPDIRNLTGSELAAVVERYDVLEVNRTLTDTGIRLDLDNFCDEAYMLLRIKEGQEVESVEGGKASKITDTCYLIDCKSDSVDITIK